MAAFYDQQEFRWFQDGTESGSLGVQLQNVNDVLTVFTADENFLLRIAVADTGSGVISNRGWQLQYSKNGGAYTNVTTSSSNVKAFNSTNLTDQGSTTNRLTGASGTFQAGGIAETGIYDNSGSLYTLGAAKNTEFLYTLTFIHADLTSGDTLDFRIQNLDAYTVTPRLTISTIAAGGLYPAYCDDGGGGGHTGGMIAMGGM